LKLGLVMFAGEVGWGSLLEKLAGEVGWRNWLGKLAGEVGFGCALCWVAFT
jgi:hypothetical protein